jgi:large subunit ribosomal protein L10e
MATLRPAKCYRKVERPWTRTSRSRPRKSYVKGVPYPKIQKFEVGDPKKKFSMKAVLVSENDVQIRHNALEAMRIAVNKNLTKQLGTEYFLKVLIYPHHVLRENAIATGAGADRFQTGMRKSFGRPIGMAARVKSGQPIIEVRADKAKQNAIKKALKIASSKIPTTSRIVFAG